MKNNLIVYEDNNIIICNKPAGMASQSERSFETDLTSYVLNYRTGRGENAYAALVNRLDKPVGGLVLFAKNKTAAGRLSAMSGGHGIEKYYYALAEGVTDEKGELTDYLLKEKGENISRVVTENTEGAKKAILFYETLGYKNLEGRVWSLIKIRLVTGRHHQIRLQMSHNGHPLYGDTKYNRNFHDRKNVFPALFAYHLSFRNPSGVDTITVEAEPESDLLKIRTE